MVIISTSAVAEIIHAVSAASIFAGCAAADVAVNAAVSTAMSADVAARAKVCDVMVSPLQGVPRA